MRPESKEVGSMKEVVEVIAIALVDKPDEYVVTETENEKEIIEHFSFS